MSATISNTAELLNQLRRSPVGERLDRLRAHGPPEDLLLPLIDEASGLTMVDADEAIEATNLVVWLADRLADPLAQARSRRARARAMSYAGRFDESLIACDEALEAARRGGHPDEAGRARLASMHALIDLGRLDDAIAAGESARSVFLSIEEPALAARAEINLGVVHQRRDRPARAVQCFDRARAFLADEPLTLGHLENNCGEALLALNDFAGAEAAFAKALRAFEDAGAALTAAIAEGNLADLAARQGRLAPALRFFERARRRLEMTHSPVHLARLIAEQAETKAILGLPEDALAEYETALAELDRCGLPQEAARARSGMGLVLLRLGRLTQSQTALAAASMGFDELGHPTARARVDLLRARLLAAQGRVHDARGVAMRSLAVLDDSPADAAAARHLLAGLAIELGESDRAEAELAAGLAAARPLRIAPLLADLLHTRGRLLRQRGRLEESLTDLREAVAHVERVRGSLQAERFRAAFLGDRSSIYQDVVGAELDRDAADSIGRSFAVAEQCKSRSLLDHLQNANALDDGLDEPSDEPAEAALGRELAQLRGELNALYSRLADEKLITRGAAAIDEWQCAVAERERALEDLESRLASARGPAALFARPAELEAVQRGLWVDEVLIEYFATADELLAFVVRRDDVSVVRDLAEPARLADHVQRVRFQIDRALRPGAASGPRAAGRLAEIRRDLAALYDVLIRPVRDRLDGARRVMIVPHGPLHMVPFHALFDGERYVVESHETHVGPSASVLLRLAAQPAVGERSGRTVVVGVADEVAPQIEDEARLVARTLGCSDTDCLIGEDATAKRVAAAMGDARLIHLATHAHFCAQSPLGSGLRLHDRWLTVRDIYGLRLRADLVTLSGCETGLNTVRAGDELIGLVRGFLAAGARSVLVGPWRVNGESTLEFMKLLYGGWQRVVAGDLTPAGALREAQLQLLRQRPHPAFWAPFVLVGRG